MLFTRIALTSLTTTASAISFFSYTALVHAFGVTSQVDEIFFAGSVPLAIAGLTSGLLLYLLPPQLVQFASNEQTHVIMRLTRPLVAIVLLIGLFAIPIYLLGSGSAFFFLLCGFVSVAALQIVSSALNCAAQARGRYLSTGIAPMIVSVSLLAGVGIASQVEQAWLFLAGLLLGTVASVLWLGNALSVPLLQLEVPPTCNPPAHRGYLSSDTLAIAIATASFTSFPAIDAALCNLLPTGSITTMSYAQRIAVTVGTAISLGAYVTVSRTSHQIILSKGHAALLPILYKEVIRILGLGLVVWGGFLALGDQLMRLLFSTAAVSSQDLATLTQVVTWMLAGVGPMATAPYLFRIYFLLQDFTRPMKIGAFVIVTYIAIAWMLLEKYKVMALPLAYAATWWLTMVIAVALLRRSLVAAARSRVLVSDENGKM